MESIEYKTPLLIAPVGIDVRYYCEFAHTEKIGGCLFEQTTEEIAECVNEIEKNDFY